MQQQQPARLQQQQQLQQSRPASTDSPAATREPAPVSSPLNATNYQPNQANSSVIKQFPQQVSDADFWRVTENWPRYQYVSLVGFEHFRYRFPHFRVVVIVSARSQVRTHWTWPPSLLSKQLSRSPSVDQSYVEMWRVKMGAMFAIFEWVVLSRVILSAWSKSSMYWFWCTVASFSWVINAVSVAATEC